MSELRLLARGELDGLAPDLLGRLLDRTSAEDPELRAAVADIVTDVRTRGDVALREMALRFDGAALDTLEVPPAARREALAGLDREVRGALERAADNIARFHRAQLPSDVSLEVEPGVRVTRVWTPLRRVGVYAPGGTAAYPSSVLMGVVPARVAGVGDIVLCSPPGPDGLPPESVLAAAEIAEADRVFALGGAGAVAALALGTESVPRVDAIVGPGNRWVTEAKRHLAGDVLIDSPAGPSEVLVLADASADPARVALELVAQAEHDPDASCVVVTTSAALVEAVAAELAPRVSATPRSQIVRAALRTRGALLSVSSLDAALAFAERYAPEHAVVMCADAAEVAARVGTAGTVFVGDASSVAFGDYLTGANHVLPTAGRAGSFSGLSIQHYLRSHTVQELTPRGAASMSEDVARLAELEGLPAHAAAALWGRRR